jgi:hypothetical protein
MSGGTPCSCPGTREERMRNWVVLQYKCNHSAFNGYHYTPSDYSSVICNGPGCSGCWRTTAKYVDDLPHEEPPK